MSSIAKYCVICGVNRHDNVVLQFTPETLIKWQYLLNIRTEHGLKYRDINLPSAPNDVEGYHSTCYRAYSALPKKYRLSSLVASSSSRPDIAFQEVPEVKSEPEETPSDVVDAQETSTGSRVCFFCDKKRKNANGKSEKLYDCKTSSLEGIRRCAEQLNDLEMLSRMVEADEVSYHAMCRVQYRNKIQSPVQTNSMPLQQRLLTMAGSTVPQEETPSAPTLKSQPLSPTKLKVTRQSATQEEKVRPLNVPPLEEVCLRWNSHHANMQTAFPSLLSKEQYCDVTLVADGKSLKCHKLILSSCSSYFDQVLERIMPYQHPVIFMKDIPFNILKSLCDFMYAGEVNILQSDLDQLLAVGESLKIKGLANRSEPDAVNIPPPKESVEKVKEAPLPPAPKPPKSVAKPPAAEKKTVLKSKDITDPLDLMEPIYEEEATPDVPPPALKRNDQTRKSAGKRVRKRKHIENDHEPSPPIFQARKGTRSRPNVKVPRYFNASFDNSNEKPPTMTATPESALLGGAAEETLVDPLMDLVEEIKTEPVDIEDGLISFEETFDMAEEGAAAGAPSFKKLNSSSAKLAGVAKQEKEDAPDPLNVEQQPQQEDRTKHAEERGTENNNAEESTSLVEGETPEAIVQDSLLTEVTSVHGIAVKENLLDHSVQEEESSQETLNIAEIADKHLSETADKHLSETDTT